jgi:hypothetical protein
MLPSTVFSTGRSYIHDRFPFHGVREVEFGQRLASSSGWRTEKKPYPERARASLTWIFLTDIVEDVEHTTPRKNSRTRRGHAFSSAFAA